MFFRRGDHFSRLDVFSFSVPVKQCHSRLYYQSIYGQVYGALKCYNTGEKAEEKPREI